MTLQNLSYQESTGKPFELGRHVGEIGELAEVEFIGREVLPQ